ncbi:hypothetical protein GUITHDRAFT_104621 [Guillardia theta CCMP2712]|uniref:Uncharacterized protein n=3 Tax=Guillardia theta TaxID=55529 RepID=L1JN01_GUITC|nr:hypothetical protein GUITHDRAFT_104621 [Guillardia theta CCMP2712]EKX49659.1 hypothetical protein GUITHDRAFT_104621 [Guillardia theta CCMP2712]|eukprot:XP_005836639.1 hypothetical protein GUITHDRAFT_104621 [Guillardia theta CCMP2712]
MEIDSLPQTPMNNDNSCSQQDPIRLLDAQLKEHFTLLYMLEPGDHLNSKLGLQDLYKKSLLSTFFYREPLTALYAHTMFQAISFIVGCYLVVNAYLMSMPYHDYPHRLVKVNTDLIQTPYQRNPTWIDFSLASCAWDENLHFVLLEVQGFALILSAMFAYYGGTRAPKRIIAYSGLIDGIGNLILYIGSNGNSSNFAAYDCLVSFFVTIFIFPCPILFMEAFVLELIEASLCIRVIAHGLNKTFRVYLLVTLGLFTLALVKKISRKATASKEMKEDAAQFDSAWQTIRARPEVQALLQETDRVLNDFFAVYPTKSIPNCKHTFMMPTSLMEQPSAGKLSRRSSRSSKIHPIDSMISISVSSFTDSVPSFPVQNLDQLYARSVVVLPIFLRKVIAIGSDWRGYCCNEHANNSGKEYVPYKDLDKSSPVVENVYFSSIKNVQRSVEKILTFLNGDVSQLTDVVRQSIFFDNLEDLNGALKQIMEDHEIEVVFIRNRLSCACSGYRDITINICFIHDVAIQTNLLGHICEIRLALMEMHSLISPAKHQEYLHRKLVLQSRRIDRGRGSNFLLLIKQGRKFLQTFSFFMQARIRSEASSGAAIAAQSPLLIAGKGMLPGGFLDYLIHSAEAGVQDAKTASVMFSSRPLSNVIRKRLFQVALIATGVIMIASWIVNKNLAIVTLWKNRRYDVSHARITVLRVRSPHVKNASITGVGFLKDCERFNPTLVASRGTQFFYSFDRQVVVNGWEFYTGSSNSSFSHDPLALEMHVSDESLEVDPTALSEARWTLISKFDCALSSTTELCHSQVANITRTRNQRYHFDLRISWEAVGEIIGMVLRLTATFGTAALACAGFIFLGKTASASAFHVAGVVDIVIAVFTPLDTLGFWQSFLWGVLELGYGLVMQFKEEHTLTLMPVFCVAGSFMNTLLIDLREGHLSITLVTLRPNHTFLFFAWLLFYVWRQYLLFQSFKKIERDIQQYHQLWKEVARDPVNLAELNDIVAKIEVQASVVQHLPRSSTAGSLRRTPIGLENSRRGGTSQRRPSLIQRGSNLSSIIEVTRTVTFVPWHLKIDSLEQLYAQALVIQPVFFEKMKELGSRCECLFLVDEEVGGGKRYISWAETIEDPESRALIRRPVLKSVHRAIQKVVRSYNGDVSRLMDIVRYALVFEDIVKLKQAVEIIRDDPAIYIARVKNRFDQSYISMKSGGYRDICLNIRVSNDYTRKFFVDNHLCELQLVLKSFMDLRSEKGHKNYRVFRDQRCE